MCIAVPGKLLQVWDQDGTPMGTVELCGVPRTVCLDLVPELRPGEYTVVHVGFALRRIDEASALETLALLKELGEFAS
jgi:hydrogenase expression/formation protein HypC